MYNNIRILFLGYFMERATLAHGSGGINSTDFIRRVFMPFFKDIMPYSDEDAGIFDISIQDSRHKTACFGVTSTDSYTINPIFFKGGDIGKLAVCGSSNDVAMMGGRPLYLNIAFIIEEGFEIAALKTIAQSIAIECKKLHLQILSADTKVLPKLTHDKQYISDSQSSIIQPSLFITTTCIGILEKSGISATHIEHDDCIIISGKIGNHGARIFLEQNNIAIDSDIQSDCASLYPMLTKIFQSDIPIHALRDATRGGLASVLNEWAISSQACIEIYEENIHIDAQVHGVCEMLGLEPYDLANEGICVMAVPKEYANTVLTLLRQHELGKYAEIIGKAQKNFMSRDDKNMYMPNSPTSSKHSSLFDDMFQQRVVLHTQYGSKRFLEYPQGELLPRIC